MRKAILLSVLCLTLTGCSPAMVLGVIKTVGDLKQQLSNDRNTYQQNFNQLQNQTSANAPMVGKEGQAAIISIIMVILGLVAKSTKDAHNRHGKLKAEVRANGNGNGNNYAPAALPPPPNHYAAVPNPPVKPD